MIPFIKNTKPHQIENQIITSCLKKKFNSKEIHQKHIHIIAKHTLDHLKKNKIDFNKENNKKITRPKKASLNLAIQQVLVSARTPWQPNLQSQALSSTQSLIFNILRGNPPSLKKLIKKDYLLSIIWKKNPEILGEAKLLLNHLFVDMVEQLNKRAFSASEIFHMEMIIGDLLSLYPFLGPEQDEELQVPIQINGKWELIDYTVDRIPLTPDWMGSPLMAFGLIPQQCPSASPLLLFKGTTYPTDEGFGLSLIVDINPFAAVGRYGFEMGKREILKWLKKNTHTSKAKIYGKSLGGALAWQTALKYPKRIDKVMTFGAPGLSSRDVKRCQRLKKYDLIPPIHMFCQHNDPVPAVDQVATTGIHYYKVLGNHHRIGIASHADVYSTHKTSSIIRIDPTHEKNRWERTALTIIRFVASLLIFPILISVYTAKIIFDQIKKTFLVYYNDLKKHKTFF